MSEVKQLNLDTLQQDLGLEYEAIFVPWSKSRNAKPDPKPSDYNLNWKIRIGREQPRPDGMPIRWLIETGYQQGTAYIPGHTFKRGYTLDEWEYLKYACEHGKVPHPSRRYYLSLGAKLIPAPAFKDVMHCLLLDSDVLDYSNFEDWANCFGYDTDSRKAEGVYRECLNIALALRNTLGDATLSQLKELYADY